METLNCETLLIILKKKKALVKFLHVSKPFRGWINVNVTIYEAEGEVNQNKFKFSLDQRYVCYALCQFLPPLIIYCGGHIQHQQHFTEKTWPSLSFSFSLSLSMSVLYFDFFFRNRILFRLFQRLSSCTKSHILDGPSLSEPCLVLSPCPSCQPALQHLFTRTTTSDLFIYTQTSHFLYNRVIL